MGKISEKVDRKPYLYLSLFLNLGLLFIFKYYNFFSDSTIPLLQYLNLPTFLPRFDLLLPVGISFYTFQALSYTIDVYRGVKESEKHFGIYALYVSFFPQLVAGPIERSTHLLPQFKKEYTFNYDKTVSGLRLILWGFFLKLVIADNVAPVVNAIYNNVHGYTGIPLIMATIFFAYQIFCDFAGYSYIAIGSARILGFDLMDNFKSPYMSKSFSEFWRRWHISLSTWFRDYLYIPLGGNRVSKLRHSLNLFIVFLISGLWHGANWTFIIWGSIHGAYLVIENTIRQILNGKEFKSNILLDILKTLIIFSFVCFAWIFFRANSISDALYVCSNLFTAIFSTSLSDLKVTLYYAGLTLPLLLKIIISIGILEFVHLVQYMKLDNYGIFNNIYLRWLVYYFLVFWILLVGAFQSSEFIYFQF
ncbi:MBOAT family O-acyltransferase [Methanococcus voltae]|uniref:MBOAT family O-acyltransferase n=1 Tax=Methanococcus voltae TaxID=2188 RepID=UPI001AE1EA36|nr:MBOAT family O-acyltransferase [Methanococcus voltae]MBP2172660.1 D-alanyl-lipoteichoic acid acyltransferase DltB (MBOAT superfamily) [Methanococcus voltae]